VALDVREAIGPRDPAEEGHVRPRRAVHQDQQRQDRADQHAAQDARAEHPHEGRQRDEELAAVRAPQTPERRELHEPRERHQHDRREDRLRQVREHARQKQGDDEDEAPGDERGERRSGPTGLVDERL
jgi:hypothetical protein